MKADAGSPQIPKPTPFYDENRNRPKLIAHFVIYYDLQNNEVVKFAFSFIWCITALGNKRNVAT